MKMEFLDNMLPFTPPSLQSIPAEQARLCLSVEKFLCSHLAMKTADVPFFIAFSGGADSTALLVILHLLRPRLGYSLEAIHLNHSIRPESGQEEDHCRALCAWLGIPFLTKEVDVPALSRQTQCGIEETARNTRYAYFREATIQKYGSWIALGHHCNDLAEDVLMRLTRGAGWPALGGMAAKDEQRKICRPLLMTSRDAIEAFLAALSIPYVNDASNNDLRYLRNRIRHTFMPLFIKENPAFLDAIAEQWRLSRLDADFFATLLEPYLPKASPCFPVSIEASTLKALPHRAMRLRLYKKWLEHCGATPSFSSILALDTAWCTQRRGACIQFSGNIHATIHKGSIVITVSC